MEAGIRAAPALIEWTQPDLAEAAKLSVPTIRRMESQRGPAVSTLANVDVVRRGLKGGGAVFLEPGKNIIGGGGVRLRLGKQALPRRAVWLMAA